MLTRMTPRMETTGKLLLFGKDELTKDIGLEEIASTEVMIPFDMLHLAPPQSAPDFIKKSKIWDFLFNTLQFELKFFIILNFFLICYHIAVNTANKKSNVFSGYKIWFNIN